MIKRIIAVMVILLLFSSGVSAGPLRGWKRVFNAEDVEVDTFDFDGQLGALDEDVQSALDTLDDMSFSFSDLSDQPNGDISVGDIDMYSSGSNSKRIRIRTTDPSDVTYDAEISSNYGSLHLDAQDARAVIKEDTDGSILYTCDINDMKIVGADFLGSGDGAKNLHIIGSRDRDAFSSDKDGGDILLQTYEGSGSGTDGEIRLESGVTITGAVSRLELSTDPSDPDEGSHVIWQSDGTGSGDDGDIMMKINAGGTTKTITLVDFSTN